MLPRLSPTAEADKVRLPPPPAYIKFPLGDIRDASFADSSPYAGKRSRPSGAQRAGLAYQKRIEVFLRDTVPSSSLDVGPWLWYVDACGRRSYCQPDFLIREPSRVVVVEVKIRWTADAWYQLRRVYLPVLSRAMPSARLVPLVICRSYDPAIRIGEAVSLVDVWPEALPEQFNVMVVRS